MSLSLQGPIVWLVGGAVLLSEKVEFGGCGFHAVISNFFSSSKLPARFFFCPISPSPSSRFCPPRWAVGELCIECLLGRGRAA